jgi:predicted dehydrogenase
MNNRLRIGVVGVGFGATVHIPAFQSEGLDVVAVCARRPERAQACAAQFGIPNAFTDYHAMLRMPGLDAVSIASPVGLHYEQTIKALDAGKHVICEKPFTPNEAGARKLWERAEESHLTAMVAHEFRFSSGRSYVKELLDGGYAGKLNFCLVRMVIGFGRPPAPGQEAPEGPPPYVAERDSLASGAGFLWGLGSHYIDGLRQWFGEVESVSGELINTSPERDGGMSADADDLFLFTLRFREGGVANMVGTRSAKFGSGATIEVYGTDGTLITPQRGPNPPAHGVVLGAQLGERELTQLPVPERLQPITDDRDDRLAPFRILTQEFVRGIREGASPTPNFYDAWRNQQVLDAIRESSYTGRRVKIEG